MVLLAEYQAPPPVDEIRVGNSLALRPRLPRARRGPSPKSKPFDAAEIYYTDSQLPDITQWRLTALLEAAKRILGWEDDGDVAARPARIERLRNELERRGFDFEALVRQGLASTIGASVISGAVMARMMGSSFDENVSPVARRARLWVPVLGLEALEPSSDPGALTRTMTFVLEETQLYLVWDWLHTAPLDHIVDLIPPGSLSSDYEFSEDTTSREIKQKYQWIMDRFTTTYLAEWKRASLKLEWKYQHGLLTPPCNNRDMATFGVSENELARQIAARSVEEDDENAGPIASSAFVPVAVSLLNAGRRTEAAAIFEAAVGLNSRDAIAINNWAFCIMPESPEKALELFDRAAGIGHHDNLLLSGNRLWCLLRLNRLTSALSVADALIGPLADQSRREAHMWSLKADVVEAVYDLRIYIADVIAAVVKGSADESISEHWNPLLETVRAAISRSR